MGTFTEFHRQADIGSRGRRVLTSWSVNLFPKSNVDGN